jgi:hypothetical protein
MKSPIVLGVMSYRLVIPDYTTSSRILRSVSQKTVLLKLLRIYCKNCKNSETSLYFI